MQITCCKIRKRWICIVFSCCVTNSCKFIRFRKHAFIISLFLCVRSLTGCNQGISWGQTISRVQKDSFRSHYFGQNSVLCSCRIKVFILLTRGHSQVQKVIRYSLPCNPTTHLSLHESFFSRPAGESL